jgi:hypothetical protein
MPPLADLLKAARRAARANGLYQPHQDAGDITIGGVGHALAGIQALFADGRAVVHRVLETDAGWVSGLAAGEWLGNHWTTDPGADLGLHVQDHGSLFAVTGTVGEEDVDLAVTVAHRCLYPHEAEVYVVGQVIFRSVARYGYGRGHGGNLRPDLDGEIMYGNLQETAANDSSPGW